MRITVEKIDTRSQRFESILAKHKAFWQREEQGFLCSSGLFAPSVPVRLRQRDGSVITQADPLTPDMFDVATLIDEVLATESESPDPDTMARRATLAHYGVGDLMPFSTPFNKIPWVEAVIGCRIVMTEGHIWVKHYQGDPEEIIRQSAYAERSPWFQLYVEFLRQLQGRLGARYPVTANTLFRGTCDLAAQVLGVSEACIGWIEQPKFMARLLRAGADVNLALIEAGKKWLRSFQGGYMSAFGVWSPEFVLRTQADHSSLLSPQMYERQILPFDLEVIRACPRSIMHIHNNGLHVAPVLAQIPELSAIEVVVDPYPDERRKAYEIEMYHRIQLQKPLILDVNFPNQEEAEWMLSQLDQRGLSFHAQFTPEVLETLPDGLPGSEHWVLDDARL